MYRGILSRCQQGEPGTKGNDEHQKVKFDRVFFSSWIKLHVSLLYSPKLGSTILTFPRTHAANRIGRSDLQPPGRSKLVERNACKPGICEQGTERFSEPWSPGMANDRAHWLSSTVASCRVDPGERHFLDEPAYKDPSSPDNVLLENSSFGTFRATKVQKPSNSAPLDPTFPPAFGHLCQRPKSFKAAQETMGSVSSPEMAWWKDGVAYQVYPASFADTNGDGLGDIPGIISKLDYLASLGIDIVWVSPMFESPQVDMGYDISNYEGVHAPYGTVEDMDVLIAECHERGMRLILDLVINHTSDQHAWFKESRSSRDNPKRDWYVWKKAKVGPNGERMPPNNWRSYFSGSVWEWDEPTQEYYLHLFAKEQPDLNWENLEARKAIYESSMRFWLEKGVDGFRVDCVNMYSKPQGYEDVPIVDNSTFVQPGPVWANGPRIHEFLREMNMEVLNNYDSVTVGELPHTQNPSHVRKFVSAGDKQLNMVFQFDIVDLGAGKKDKYCFEPWKLSRFKEIVATWQQFIEGTDAWTTVFCENHDQGRSVSRYASDDPKYRELSAKMLCIMLCSLTGTLFVYQGQEIGMVNVPKHWPIEDYQDIESVNFYRDMEKKCQGDKKVMDYVMSSIQVLGRDNARLPMHWDDSDFAGFTKRKEGAWMRVHDLYPEINVAKQESEPDSVLSFWKEMIQLRKEKREVFVHGSFRMVEPDSDETFIFVKQFGQEKAVVALNFSGTEQTVNLPEKNVKLRVGNYLDAEAAESQSGLGTKRVLRPWEGRLYLAAVD